MKCIGSPQCARCEAASILCQFDFTEKKVPDGPLLDSIDVVREHHVQLEHDSQQNQSTFDIDHSMPVTREAGQTSVEPLNAAVQQLEWQDFSAGNIPSNTNLEEDGSAILLDGLTRSSSSTKESCGAESVPDTSQGHGPPASTWCGDPREQEQNYVAENLFAQPVLDWDLPSPFQLVQVEMNLGLAQSPDHMPGSQALGLSPFVWTDLAGPFPSLSELGDKNPSPQITEDGSKSVDSEMTSTRRGLPWIRPGTTLNDMYDALTANSYPHWCREIPRINQSEAQRYWDLHFERFNQVSWNLEKRPGREHALNKYL